MGWGTGGECTWKFPAPTGVTSQPQCPSILGVQLVVSGKSLALGRGSAWGFLTMAFLPVALSWAVKTGACTGPALSRRAAVAAVPMCPPFPPCCSSCLLQTHVFRALQDLPCFFALLPHVSPPARSLPIQGPPLPTARAPKEGHWKMKIVLFQIFLPQMQAPETREAPGACGSDCVCACLGGDYPAL